MHPSILLTNDDGIQSPAFDALEKAVSPLGKVTIVAPDREMSASSHSLTLNQPLRYHQVGGNRYSVQGTPADCVILASLKILEERPALVISGVNRGANVGDDIAYSGTVAGAVEAALQGIHGIAISTVTREDTDFKAVAEIAGMLALKVLRDGLPKDVILNVNFPRSWNGQLRVTRQGRRGAKTVLVENLDPRGKEYFWLHEELHNKGAEPGVSEPLTDYAAIQEGFVSISPIQIDRTAYTYLDRIQRWLS